MDTTKRNLIVGFGELLWDVLPDGRRLGGAPANFAYHCKAFGGSSEIISAVGQDQPGADILQQLSDRQVSTDYIKCNEHRTSWVDVELHGNGHPHYVIHENVAWDHIELSANDIELAESCTAVCFGTLAQRHKTSRESILKFLSHTSKNCLRIFDINLRQNYYSLEIINRSLEATNILKLNDDELSVLQNLMNLPDEVESALQTLMNRYQLDLIALTQVQAGSLMIDRKETSFCPATPAQVIDTIGAGDSFTAAITMGKLNGLPLNQTHHLASRVAAYVCSQAGATPALPGYLISEINN